MTVQGTLRGDTIYLCLIGEIDSFGADRVRRECDRLIEGNIQAARIVFNMERVSFVDSAVIGFLMGRYKKASSFNIPVFIQSPPFSADKLLSLSGIYSIIPKTK